MISRDFTFIMNMFLFSDQRGGIESVHPESNWVSVTEIDNGDSEWLDWRVCILFIRKRKRIYDVGRKGVGGSWKI